MSNKTQLQTNNANLSYLTNVLNNKKFNIVLQNKTITPTELQQNIVSDNGYDGLSQVIVNKIPSSYIQPTGTKTITSNGTHDVMNYANAEVNVASDGGADIETCTVDCMIGCNVLCTTYSNGVFSDYIIDGSYAPENVVKGSIAVAICSDGFELKGLNEWTYGFTFLQTIGSIYIVRIDDEACFSPDFI